MSAPHSRPGFQLLLAATALLGALFPPHHAMAESPETTPPSGELRWKNGDALQGQIQSASEQQLQWKSPHFQSPLSLFWDALQRIDFASQAVPQKDPFAFTTRDGSHFFGSLESVSTDAVFIQSRRHGSFSLSRSELVSIRRVHRSAPQFLLQGPLGASPWKPLPQPSPARSSGQNSSRPTPLWSPLWFGPGGALELPFLNQAAVLPVELPNRGQIECAFHADTAPQLQLTLRTPDQRSFSLESWDSFWVLHAGDSFSEIPLQKDSSQPSNSLRFRLFWDLAANSVQALSEDGSPIATLSIPAPAQSKESPGLLLTNKGRRLSLTSLRIQSTASPTPTPVSQSILASEGRLLHANIAALANGTLTLQPADSSKESLIPLDSVDALVFQTDPSATPRNKTEWSFNDGTFLVGETDSIQQGRAHLRTAFSPTPFPTDLQDLRLLRCRPLPPAASPEPSAQTDLLTLNESVQLRGRFQPGNTATGTWIPHGSEHPVAPVPGSPLTVSLKSRPAALQPAALLHTRTGEVLSGSMQSVSPNSFLFQSSFSESREFPIHLISGVILAPRIGAPISGFSDPAWQLLKGPPPEIDRETDKLEMNPGTALFLPNAMSQTALEFEIHASGFSVTSLRFFVNGETPEAPQLKIISMGNSIRLLAENDPMLAQTEIGTTPGKPALLRLVPEKNGISIFCNGAPSARFQLPSEPTGTGMWIEPGEAWGNGINPITLARFRSEVGPSSIPTPVVPKDARNHALTVPRFRKDSPPTHALIAPNGDLLTGIVESATASLLTLRSGLETFTLPLNRVQALVWTRPPNPPANAASPLQVLRNRLATKIAAPYQVTGTWETHAAQFRKIAPFLDLPPHPKGGTKFPKRISLSDVPLASVLESICTAFSLQHRLNSGGKIELVPAPSSPNAPLETRFFWLRQPPFPDSEDPQSFLMEQGIPFPSGAALSWDPNSATLTHTNTAHGLYLLTQYLKSKPNNLLGSPTHWLLLHDGSRLQLQVENFGPECVTGFHPVLGKTSIPTPLLSEIRSTPPQRTSSSLFLDSWQLVAAPEPIIPSASGNPSSPVHNVPAPDFKLPLLGGDEFDLSKHRGKVVILDFWASWCGPCVRALPELMEAAAQFPAEKVLLVGVNQAEAVDAVQTFLQKRRWTLTTTLDAAQSVAKQYGVDGIPHTVVIAPDGTIASVQSGYSPEATQALLQTVRSLLP